MTIMTKSFCILLIVILLAIEAFPKHLPITRKSVFDSIESEYSDIALQTRSEAIKAYLDRMDKESALAGRPRFVSHPEFDSNTIMNVIIIFIHFVLYRFGRSLPSKLLYPKGIR